MEDKKNKKNKETNNKVKETKNMIMIFTIMD